MYRLFNLVFVSATLLCFSVRSQDLCPTPDEFYNHFQSLKQLEVGSLKQEDALKKWRIDWEKCYLKSDSIYVNTLIYTGMNHYRKGDLKEAIKWHKEAISLFENNQGLRLKRSSLTKIYYRLGVFYTNSQKLDESTEVLHKVIDLAGNNPDLRIWVNQAHLYLIYSYFVLGDFERALQHASVGEIISTELEDPITLSKVLQQKAQVLQSLKLFNEALSTIEKAILLMKKSSVTSGSLSSQYMLKGNILRDLKRNDLALTSLVEAYTIAKQGNEKHLSDFPIAIGYFHQTEKKYALAIQYYEDALEMDTGSHNKCLIYNNLANISKLKGNYPEAIRFLHLGLQTLLPDIQIKDQQAHLTAKSIKSLQQKEYLLSLTRDYAETWLTYAKEKEQPSYLENALKTFMQADSMIDFMRWQHTGHSSKLYWREQTSAMYELAIEASILSNDLNRAFYFFEKSRAVLLNDELNSRGATQQLKSNDLLEEKKIRQLIDELQHQLTKEDKNSPHYLSLVDQLLKAETKQKAFVSELQITNPTYYNYRYNNDVPSVQDIQTKILDPMGQGSSFLTYHIGEKKIYGICITPNSTQIATLNKATYDSLIQKINVFLPNKSLQNQSHRQFLEYTHTLYKLLITPFTIKENSRVIISTNNEFFPFEILSSSSDHPDYWGLHHPISYTYSGNFLLKRQPRSSSDFIPKSFLGVAPVEFSPILKQATLFDSDQATEKISSFFTFSETLLHQKATRKTFLEKLPQYKIVQLLTHAIADSTQSEPTLYFADSTLLLSDIQPFDNINTQLIVLSACQTGIGKFQTGEGIYSLARGFASTGIPSILTTLWSVENQPIYKLTTLFFKHLKESTPLDIALFEARKEWMNTSTGADLLPYTWAGIVLIGNTDSVITNDFSWHLIIAGVLIILLIFLVTLYYYRRTKLQKRF